MSRSMHSYLDEAARLLSKAAEESERKYSANQHSMPSVARRELIEDRERIAMKFAQLGAIEAGVVPPEMVEAIVAAAVRQAREESSR